MNKYFDRINQLLDRMEKRFMEQDPREDQSFNESIDRMDECFMIRDATSVEMKDLRSNCQTEGIPGQQARVEGEDAYSEESGESEDDSTVDGVVRVTPSEKRHV